MHFIVVKLSEALLHHNILGISRLILHFNYEQCSVNCHKKRIARVNIFVKINFNHFCYLNLNINNEQIKVLNQVQFYQRYSNVFFPYKVDL